MEYRGFHKYYTSGEDNENRQEALQLLTEKYGFKSERMDAYELTRDDFFLRITDRWGERFEITLQNQSKDFNPTISCLEFKILGHFLQVAGVKSLVNGLKEPLDHSVFEALLDCHK